MNNPLVDRLISLQFKPLTDFSLSWQKRFISLLNNKDENIIVYAKVEEQLIEFSDNNNKPLWKTKLSLVSFVILDTSYSLVDKFITPSYPFRIRNSYEADSLMDLYEKVGIELSELDEFIPEREEEIIYES